MTVIYPLFQALTSHHKTGIIGKMDTVYTKELTIRFSETDNTGKFKVVSMFDSFQDVGSEHAAVIKLSARDLLTRNYTWVMLKYNVRIERLPMWNESVVMKTWRCPHRNLYELREFDLYDRDGNRIIQALSSWVMMNFDSRKPVRLDRFIPQEQMDHQKSVPDDFSRLTLLQEFDEKISFKVRMQDIDFNNHVNNSVYIGWAIEAVPETVLQKQRLKQIEVNYINEISHGNVIYSRIRKSEETDETVFYHNIMGGDGRTELTRLKTVWQN